MLRRNRYNMTDDEKAKHWANKQHLIEKKETVILKDEWHGYCDNSDHPLFTINVTIDRPFGVCYYCSKVWKLKDNK